MTANQIEYNKLRETQRANRENERLTGERDLAARELGKQTLAETQRSNLARESETARANLAKEAETVRANLAREAETYRSNTVGEKEAERSHRASEDLKLGENVVKGTYYTARAASDAARVVEQIRHNKAMELKDVAPKVTVAPSVVVPSSTSPITNSTGPIVLSPTTVVTQSPRVEQPAIVGKTTQKALPEPGLADFVLNKVPKPVVTDSPALTAPPRQGFNGGAVGGGFITKGGKANGQTKKTSTAGERIARAKESRAKLGRS